jgi:hypothetical protein
LDTQISSAAATAEFRPVMSVIDSLKRLERIGSEESETVRKIVEAAKDLSATIVRAFPESLYDRTIIGFRENGVAHIGKRQELPPPSVTRVPGSSKDEADKATRENTDREAREKSVYVFQPYSVNSHGVMRIHAITMDRYVYADRETALEFSKEIAEGLLDVFAKLIEEEHKESESVLAAILKVKADVEQR